MKKKIILLGLCVLLAASMIGASVITSCGTKSTTTPTSTTSPNTPQTGGSLTLFTQWGGEEPSGFDDLTTRIWSGSVWINPFTEWLCRGDVEKYGPRGDNSFGFQTYEMVPEQYLGGELAQTWEVSASPLQITFQLRHGIMFTGNTKIGMAAREVVASDVVFSIKRTIATPGPGSYLAMIKDVTAPDKYTVQVTLNVYDANWFFIFGGGMAMGAVQPKEMADANANGEDWHNAVGSGPFILTDYTAGVGATYTRNPNYWGTTTINGKSYQTPFIDTLYYPVMADPSTQLAALRTAQVDWMPNVAMENQQTLVSTVPDMVQNKYLNGKVDQWRINRQGSKTLNNKNVRQALMIGLDLQNISDLLYNSGPIVSWPIGPQTPGYTKLADLPAVDQALYTYSTTKAKQMLSDAGYPSGFTVEVDVDAAHQDLANACASMWAKINVTANIKVLDSNTLTSLRDQVTYPDMLYSNYTVVNPLVSEHLAASDVLASNYLSSEPFEAMYKAAAQEQDPVKRTTLEKALGVALLDDCGMISFAQPYTINCYWPWMKNYYGELDAGYYNQMPMIKTMWIDKNLKKTLGH
jgi:peptide/nickel transport system substrate-binding protein